MKYVFFNLVYYQIIQYDNTNGISRYRTLLFTLNIDCMGKNVFLCLWPCTPLIEQVSGK